MMGTKMDLRKPNTLFSQEMFLDERDVVGDCLDAVLEYGESRGFNAVSRQVVSQSASEDSGCHRN